MGTRENHAELAVEALERIAAIAAPRIGSKTKLPAADFFDQLQVYGAPRISGVNACIPAAACFIAMHRGHSPGDELEDWLPAEYEVDARRIG
jgi:Protein of unknown function (DUF2934)